MATYTYDHTNSARDLTDFFNPNNWLDESLQTPALSPLASDSFVIDTTGLIDENGEEYSAENPLTFGTSASSIATITGSISLIGFVKCYVTNLSSWSNISIDGQATLTFSNILYLVGSLTMTDSSKLFTTSGSLNVRFRLDFSGVAATATIPTIFFYCHGADSDEITLPGCEFGMRINLRDATATNPYIFRLPSTATLTSFQIHSDIETPRQIAFDRAVPVAGNISFTSYNDTSKIRFSESPTFRLIGTNNQTVSRSHVTLTQDSATPNFQLAKTSGTVALNAISWPISGYCGTHSDGSFISDLSPNLSTVTIAATSDVTFSNTTTLAKLINLGTCGKIADSTDVTIYNYVNTNGTSTGTIDTSTRFRPTFYYYYYANDINDLSTFLDANNWTMASGGSGVATVAPTAYDHFSIATTGITDGNGDAYSASNLLTMTLGSNLAGSLTISGYVQLSSVNTYTIHNLSIDGILHLTYPAKLTGSVSIAASGILRGRSSTDVLRRLLIQSPIVWTVDSTATIDAALAPFLNRLQNVALPDCWIEQVDLTCETHCLSKSSISCPHSIGTLRYYSTNSNEICLFDMDYTNLIHVTKNIECYQSVNLKFTDTSSLCLFGSYDQTISFQNATFTNNHLTITLQKTSGTISFQHFQGHVTGISGVEEGVANTSGDSLISMDAGSNVIISENATFSDFIVHGTVQISENATLLAHQIQTTTLSRLSGNGMLKVAWGIQPSMIEGDVGDDLCVCLFAVPDSPTLSLSSKTENAIQVSWTSVENASRYIVNVYDIENNGELKGSYSTNQTTYRLDDLLNHTKYRIEVLATSFGGQTSPSPLITKTLGLSPQIDSVSTRTHSSVYLSWSNVSYATFYKIDVSLTNDFSNCRTIESTDNSCLINELNESTTYYLRLCAVDIDQDETLKTTPEIVETFAQAIVDVDIVSSGTVGESITLDATNSVGDLLSVDWGDGCSDSSRLEPENWLFSHIYENSGLYEIKILSSEPGEYYKDNVTCPIVLMMERTLWNVVGKSQSQYKVLKTQEINSTHGETFALLMAQIKNSSDSSLLDIDGIDHVEYSIYKLGNVNKLRKYAVQGHSHCLVGGKCFFYQTLQNNDLWNVDQRGYNFSHCPDSMTYPVFPETGTYEIVYVVKMLNSNPIVLKYKVFA